jgi:hypothetical protein
MFLLGLTQTLPLVNPVTVLKARYESNLYGYTSFPSAFASIVRSGPSELFRGFLASSLRDAPYAGLFVVFYEGIKREACANLFLLLLGLSVLTYLYSISFPDRLSRSICVNT